MCYLVAASVFSCAGWRGEPVFMSPRIANRQSKPAVLHQTLEIPSASPATEETPKERETRPHFWTYMRSLTPEDWKDDIVYLTPQRPKTHMNRVAGAYFP